MSDFGRIVVVLSMLVSSATIHAQSTQGKYWYIAQAANEIFGVQASSPDFGVEQMLAVAQTTCSAFTRLLSDDSEFRADVQRLAESGDEIKKELESFRNDFDRFHDAFLLQEEEVLKQAGLSNEAIVQLTAAMTYVSDSLQGSYDPMLVINVVEGIRERACSSSRQIFARMSEGERKKALRKYKAAVGGIAIIVADAVFASTGVANLSYALGGAAIGPAATDFIEQD